MLPTSRIENKILIAEKQAHLTRFCPLLNLYQEIYSNLIVLGQPSEKSNHQDLH